MKSDINLVFSKCLLNFQKKSFNTSKAIFFTCCLITAFFLFVSYISFSQSATKDTVVFGSDKFYPPFEYLDKNGNPVGFNIDLIRMVASEMDVELIIKLDNWENIRRALEVEGTIDISDMFYTKKRDSLVDFAFPHLITYDQIFLNSETKPIAHVQELNGKTVAMQKSSTIEEYIQTHHPEIKIISTITEFEALQLVSEKKCFAAIVSQASGSESIKKLRLKNITSYGHLLLPREYGFVVKEGNTELLTRLNDVMARLIVNGEIENLKTKWFPVNMFGFTSRYIGFAILILLAVIIAVFIINFWLRIGIKKRKVLLKTSEEKFKAIVEAIPDLVFVCDRNGVFLDFHKPDSEKLFTAPKEFLGKKIIEIMPHELNTQIIDSFKKCLTSLEKQYLEYTLEIDGKSYDYEAILNPLKDDKILILSRNITERKTIDKVIRESQIRLNGVVQNASEGISITDEDGKIFVWNKALEEITGINSSTVIGKNMWDIQVQMNPVELQTTEFTEKYKKSILDFLKTGYSPYAGIALERNYIKPNGDEIIIKGIINSIKSENGFLLFSTTEDITVQKLAESDLRKKEQEFREIYNSTSEAIFIHDALNGKILDCNNRAFQMFGYNSKEEILKLNIELLSGENELFTNEKVIELIKKTINEKIDQTFEWKAKKRNGDIFWIENSIKETQIGGENRVIVVCRDITERKNAEQNIMETTANLKSLLDNRNDYIWSLDRDYNYIVFNKIYEEILFSASGVRLKKGMNALEILPVELHDFWKSKYEPAFRGENVNFEFSRILNGSEHYFQVSLNPIFNNGIITGASALSIDITDRKLAEKELRESEEYNRMLFDQSSIGLAVTNMKGKLIDINSAFSAIIGRTIEETKSLSYWDITPEKYNKQEHLLLLTLEKTGSYGPYEKEYIHKNGQLIPVSVRGKLIERNGERFIWSSVEDITIRKKTEQLLKESEKRFSQIMQSVNLVSIILEPDATLSYCNDYFLQITGYLREEVIGKNWFEMFIPSKISPKINKVFLDAISSNSFVTYMENELKIKNDELKIIAWNNTLIKNEKGKITGVACLGEDISKRKEAEKALEISEERFRLISGVTSDYMFASSIDNQGRLLTNWVFGAFESITGYTLNEYLENGGWRATVHPDDLKIDDQDLAQLNKNQNVVTELRTYTKNGNLVWVRVYAHPIWDNENNRLTGIYGAVQDITMKKEAENLIRTSENKFKALVEQSLTGICIFETERFIYVNARYCEIFGFSEEEILTALKPADLMVAEDLEKARESLGKKVEGKNTSERHITRGIHKTGKILWIEIFGTRLDLGGKNVIAGTVLDITDRKKAEEEIMRLNEELEQKVMKRTEDLEIKILEIERMNRLFVGRELRMKELKEKMKELKEKLEEKNK